MFLPERIRNYWNALPMYCKESVDVANFKINLERFKKESIHSSKDNYWEVSDIVISKIEGNPNYLANKNNHNMYLLENPRVARKKGINTFIRS